jgi:hypothetical protein
MSPSHNRYECPIHGATLRFYTDHWECPDGHDTALARDTAEDCIVKYSAWSHGGARTVM